MRGGVREEFSVPMYTGRGVRIAGGGGVRKEGW